MSEKKIGVLMGGPGAEREVSIRTGAGVLAALIERGHEAVSVTWNDGDDIAELLRREKIEIVWNAMHGTYGEDGAVQGLLECLKIPYTGSGVAASALAMDKVVSKILFERAGVPTPAWRVIGPDDDPTAAAAAIGYPLVVKPAAEGSTVGISIVRAPAGLGAALIEARRHRGAAIVEKFIAGSEISVGILDGVALDTVEIRPKSGFYDYEAKYESEDTDYLVPAPLSPDIDRVVRNAAVAMYRVLGCSAHARADFRIDEAGKAWALEVNTLPGMTAHSLLPKIAAHAGMDYGTLVERVLATAKVFNA